MSAIINLDKSLSQAIHDVYNATVGSRGLLMLLEFSGHGVPWLVFCFYMVISNFYNIDGSLKSSSSTDNDKNDKNDKNNLEISANFLLGMLTDLIWVVAIKPVVRRPRPHYNRGEQAGSVNMVDQFSFPSGHTTRAVFCAMFIAAYFGGFVLSEGNVSFYTYI